MLHRDPVALVVEGEQDLRFVRVAFDARLCRDAGGLLSLVAQPSGFAPGAPHATEQRLEAQGEQARELERALTARDERKTAAPDQDQPDDGECNQERTEGRERFTDQLAEQQPDIAAGGRTAK